VASRPRGRPRKDQQVSANSSKEGEVSECDECDDFAAEIVQQDREEERESEPPCAIKPVFT
jgi:hypothetical protein